MTEPNWRTMAVGLAVALVLSLAGLCFALVNASGDGASVSSRGNSPADVLIKAEGDAEKAARAAAVHLTTYDYKSLATDFDWAVAAGTEKFQQRYAEVSAPTKKYVAELKVHAEGSVDQSAATAQDADHVTVLLFVDQTLTSASSTERQLATPRVRMSMVRQGGAWLVDDVTVRNLVEQ